MDPPFIADGLAAFARGVAGVSGTFCVGDFPTIADCCLVPQLNGARRFQVDLEPFANLLAIEAHCLPLPRSPMRCRITSPTPSSRDHDPAQARPARHRSPEGIHYVRDPSGRAG